MLLDLLKDIKRDQQDYDLKLLIYNDASKKSYQKVTWYLKQNFHDHEYYHNKIKNGKPGYWKTINWLFDKLKESEFDYVIQLPDDVRLVDDFFNKSIIRFQSITDPKKICLNLLNDYSRDGKNFWTSYLPFDCRFNEYYFTRNGWIDGCYLANNKFFELLKYTIEPVSPRWTADPNKSSGVGMQVSYRIVRSKHYFYQVKFSLVIHGNHKSVMHPQHRLTTPLISNHMRDKVTATMATMPARMNSLEETVASILPQVNELHIYLNDFTFIPGFLQHEKIKLYKSQEYAGDLGDAGKYFTADQIKGYHFTIDDDIIYPANYISIMIEAIEKYQRKAIITTHGRRFKQFPVKSYYHADADSYRCDGQLVKDEKIHVGGSGVMAYHTDTIKFSISNFKVTNMADIWVAIKCQNEGIPIICIAHKRAWITISKKFDNNYSIYVLLNRQDFYQTELVNSIVWG